MKTILSNLSKQKYGAFEYKCGKFLVRVYKKSYMTNNQADHITLHSNLELVILEEWCSNVYKNSDGSMSGAFVHINLNKDPRFMYYEPIKYNGWNGNNMPTIKLCELIKYLPRLNNLEVFS